MNIATRLAIFHFKQTPNIKERAGYLIGKHVDFHAIRRANNGAQTVIFRSNIYILNQLIEWFWRYTTILIRAFVCFRKTIFFFQIFNTDTLFQPEWADDFLCLDLVRAGLFPLCHRIFVRLEYQAVRFVLVPEAFQR
ncbi:hypothetical protein DAI18_15340 [Microvirgula aerodenitrificans]|uniref:Uncharacterized protein n=1 Tax=Microvirgula aerodenitrificans TaxID=57480 RepID=A0A2S0PCZ1_9NEIS|nr:hypothetical protein DAI18_15340 [Microvirgula aerodenitrificans]